MRVPATHPVRPLRRGSKAWQAAETARNSPIDTAAAVAASLGRAMARLTKDQLDNEARNVARKVSHRPIAEIIQIISERQRRKDVTEAYVRSLLEGRP